MTGVRALAVVDGTTPGRIGEGGDFPACADELAVAAVEPPTAVEACHASMR
ncbi:hypothetical protein ABZ816_04840 [Actinosynnema sp. NPDC047251]|uniref:hypothetical protein n=1 Tax=Saccharothrix espanaensis TaxID=103731 RepID=UPI0002D9D8D1|nr:hypothetical protein [Saccharothrix espanaensis]